MGIKRTSIETFAARHLKDIECHKFSKNIMFWTICDHFIKLERSSSFGSCEASKFVKNLILERKMSKLFYLEPSYDQILQGLSSGCFSAIKCLRSKPDGMFFTNSGKLVMNFIEVETNTYVLNNKLKEYNRLMSFFNGLQEISLNIVILKQDGKLGWQLDSFKVWTESVKDELESLLKPAFPS